MVTKCCGGFPNLSHVQSKINEGWKQVGKTAGKVVHGLNIATNSVESRSYTHLFLSGLIKTVEVASGILPGPLQIFSTIIDTTEGAFAAWDFFTVGKYFFKKEAPESKEPRIVKNKEGKLCLKRKNHGTTQAKYHVEEKKFSKLVCQVASAVKATGALGLFLHAFKIVNLETASASLGRMGTAGKIAGAIVAPAFFSTLVSVGGIALFGTLTYQSVVYLCKTRHDPSKSVAKGLIDLASRVSILALFVVTAGGVYNPYLLIPLMAVGGAFGIAGIFHHVHREAKKEAIQKQNMAELMKGGNV